MESRIYPSWDQLMTLHNPLTEGEKALILFLDNNLPKDINWKKNQRLSDYHGWLIFAQPFLNGSRPDIIIFNPYVSVMIYEVKDWKLIHYNFVIDCNGSESLHVKDSKGSYKIKDPCNQVKHYKEIIIGQLIPDIGEMVDRNKNNYGLIKTGLYFHNENTNDVREFFKKTDIENVKSFPIIGNDYLRKENIEEIIPDVKYKYGSKFWKRKWNDDLMFWLNPPEHSIEQGKPLTLKNNQFKIAEPNTGHHRVRGVAGSGKTQALAYRAAKLASMGLSVLVVTFNITLWHYIKDMIARAPFKFQWNKITFNHFHGFCKDVLNSFEINWPEYKGIDIEYFFQHTIPEIVINATQKRKVTKYDAILIDEGQDYHYEWYSLLANYFLSNRDEVLVVIDKKQNIYDRKLDWLDKRITRQGLEKFKDPYIDLTVSFRMPSGIAGMTNNFSELFKLNQELKVNKTEFESALIYTQHLVWININESDWLSFVYSAYLRLKKEEKHPSDVIILLPNHKQGIECVKFFESINIEVNHVFEEDLENNYHIHKKSFWLGDSRVKMSTIHSFKGWELNNIVILIPPNAPGSKENLDAVVYTAMTRTKENLIVLNTNNRYNKFGDDLPGKWDEQEKLISNLKK